MYEHRRSYVGGHRTSRRYMGSSGMSLATLTKQELLYIAKLIYDADSVSTDFNKELPPAITLFIEICINYGVGNKLRDILDWELKRMEESRLIEMYDPDTENPEQHSRFSVTHDRFKYRIDSSINSLIPEDMVKDCNLVRIRLFVDIYRVMFSAEDEKEFARIWYSLFIADGSIENVKYVPPKALPKKIRNISRMFPKIEFLQESIDLPDVESAYINLLFLSDQITQLRSFVSQCGDLQSCIFQRFLNISAKEFNMLNRRSGILRSFGFLMDDGYVDYDLREAIVNQSMDFYYKDILKKITLTETYNLSSFNVNEEKTHLICCFLKGTESCSILLRGAPGAGKTEYAKALAAASGLRVYMYINETEIQGSHILAKLNTFLSMKQKDCVLIVDEADKILSTMDKAGLFGMPAPNSNKGIVNKMLENSRTKAIWIVNYDDGMDESTKRRFTISHYFDPMTETQLRSIADSKLKVLGLDAVRHEKILDLFGKYRLSGSSVDNVIKGLKSIGNENAEIHAEMILKANSELQYGRQRIRDTVSASYDISIVNTTIPAEDIIRRAENNIRYAAKHPGKNCGFRLLFYGVSGTGKTELARYIAQKLGKPISLKRPSDILDKYVGESEKKIAEAFAECERTGAVLLFDEADSFFADRKQAEHNWERTQVNEFLTQMQDFNGIVICTTNLRNIMDDAMPRRFSKMVEFKPLTEKGISVLLAKYFPEFKFTSQQIQKIDDYASATPGDFAVVEDEIRFMDEDKVNADYIVDELAKFQEEKCRNEDRHHCIGFTA